MTYTETVPVPKVQSLVDKNEMVQKLWRLITSKYFLAFLSSIFFLLTLPPFRQSWIAGVALVPLLLLIEKEHSFWKNFLSGVLAVLPYLVYEIGRASCRERV